MPRRKGQPNRRIDPRIEHALGPPCGPRERPRRRRPDREHDGSQRSRAESTHHEGPGDQRSRLDVALRIPGDQLRYLVSGDSAVGQVRVTVEFRSRFGQKESSEARTLRVVAPPSTAGGYSPGHLLVQTYAIHPGFRQVIVKLEDLQKGKTGLAYVGRKVPRRASPRG